ncbi:substrate-binding periplasmic protein [Salinicola rhizosphaerae]|uniref:Polar amino acid ABC transporter substrate-binding protein n=1 Tax=Salinicola rhizosphaerae TaxID=1443141 RepID=A0ABQ3DUR3_9GAMM|nr:ABC transporter substrate-binding protein [Salinicola rhizosphaerae]GHB17128.1 polar amino acid ABC transporter substrate-binding protein [Salinicola rhizosphaerae]
MKTRTLISSLLIVGGTAIAGQALAQDQSPIRAASDVGYPPFATVGNDGSYQGYDIDIAKAISKQIGRKIDVIDQPWSTTYAGLNSGKFDMVLSAAMITKNRADGMLFAEAYGDATYQFVQRASDATIESPDDLKGKTIAVNKGNLFDRWLTERQDQYGWKINRYDKNSDAIQSVASGQTDAALVYSASAGDAANRSPLLAVSDYVIDNGEVYGYSFRKDDEALRDEVDAAIECLKHDGTLAKLYTKWTGLEPKADGAVNTIYPGYGQPGFPGYDDTEHDLDCQ